MNSVCNVLVEVAEISIEVHHSLINEHLHLSLHIPFD